VDYPGDGTVVKIHPGDGTIAGTYNAGFAPNGIAFDGTYIWMTDQLGMVHQLRASDGAHIGTYQTGKRPQWVTLGEGHVWITNGDDDTVSAALTNRILPEVYSRAGLTDLVSLRQ